MKVIVKVGKTPTSHLQRDGREKKVGVINTIKPSRTFFKENQSTQMLGEEMQEGLLQQRITSKRGKLQAAQGGNEPGQANSVKIAGRGTITPKKLRVRREFKYGKNRRSNELLQERELGRKKGEKSREISTMERTSFLWETIDITGTPTRGDQHVREQKKAVKERGGVLTIQKTNTGGERDINKKFCLVKQINTRTPRKLRHRSKGGEPEGFLSKRGRRQVRAIHESTWVR